MTRIYLDHHTATRPLTSVIEGILPFYNEHWGDTTAFHQMGQELLFYLKKDIESLHQELGADQEDQFYFCSSGAEAINSVFLSHYLDYVLKTSQNHIITTNIEEAPILMSIKRLETLGCIERILPVNAQGQITKELLEQSILPETSLVSLSWANGLTGVIHPIEDLAAVCRKHQVRLHVDASYMIGKTSFRFSDLSIDFLSFEGRLIHAPKGTGGLLVKKSDISFHPLVAGEAGENIPGIHAIAKAVEESSNHFDHLNLETARLRDKLEKGIVNGIEDAIVFFKEVNRLPNCTAIGFPGVISDALLYRLHRKGVYATQGGGHSQKLSHVLVASGVDEILAQCALSFSLSFETTEEEIDYAIKTIVACVQELKSYSRGVLR